MSQSAAELVAEVLTGTVELLDIPAELQAAAEATYEDVGLWMGDNLEGRRDWHVYPQGSMRLGTVVRPSPADEYDIDAVAECDVDKDHITQADLKALVGDALKGYVQAHRGDDKAPTDCEDGRRCWTLTYERQPFHMDVLPAIPNREAGGIWLADRDMYRWLPSNPIAFADWFHRQAAAELATLRKEAAASRQVDVDAVPSWEVKTTLQQSVQVLKLHRNLYFADDLEARPPSCLVTTLAAQSYRGQRLLFDAVMDAASTIPSLIGRDGSRYVVANPVQPDENFADRWGEDPERARRFFAWLSDLEQTLERAAATAGGLDKMVAGLGERFGVEAVTKSAARLGQSRAAARRSGALTVTTAGALSTGAGMRVPDHVFHGD